MFLFERLFTTDYTELFHRLREVILQITQKHSVKSVYGSVVYLLKELLQ